MAAAVHERQNVMRWLTVLAAAGLAVVGLTGAGVAVPAQAAQAQAGTGRA